MILIIKSTHSLSILTDRSSGWWATLWVTIQSISILTDYPNDQNTIATQSWQWIQSIQKRRIHDRTLFSSYRSTLSIIILNTVKWFQYSISHYSICLTHPSHTLLLWRTDCYSFQSIRISVLPTLFIVIISMTVRYHHTVSLSTHQSILMDTKQCMITIR